MSLIELLLPRYNSAALPFPRAEYERVAETLTRAFRGSTACTRAPSEGRWSEPGEGTSRDEIVACEVMSETLGEPWWRNFRCGRERRYAPQKLVVHAEERRPL